MEIPAKAGFGHGTFVLQARLGTVSIFLLTFLSVLIMCDLENWQGNKDKRAFQIWHGAGQSQWMVDLPGAAGSMG